ncbi:MAG: hypothetical protein QXY62_00635 [Candidatus Altiarchaeota archaeon]
MKKEVTKIFLVVCSILISGCINNNSSNNSNSLSNMGSYNQLTQNKPIFGRPFNGSMENRSGWPRMGIDHRKRSMWNITQFGGEEHNWSGDISNRLFGLRRRLNLSSNASENEVQEALQKIREERGM